MQGNPHVRFDLQHWEGLALLDKAEKLAADHGGTLRRVAASPTSPTAFDTAAQ
jgi:hypothetical protein